MVKGPKALKVQIGGNDPVPTSRRAAVHVHPVSSKARSQGLANWYFAVHDRLQGLIWSAGAAAEGGGDAGMSGQPQDGDGEVPQGAVTRGPLAVRTWERSSS